MRFAALGQAHAKHVVTHHYSSGILGTVWVHVNASIPNHRFQKTPALGEGFELNTDLVHANVQVDQDGYIVILKGPGLGIELDPEIVEKYRFVG